MTTLDRMLPATCDTVATLIEGCAAAGPIRAATDRHAAPAIVDDPPRLIRSRRLRAASPLRDIERSPRDLRGATWPRPSAWLRHSSASPTWSRMCATPFVGRPG